MTKSSAIINKLIFDSFPMFNFVKAKKTRKKNYCQTSTIGKIHITKQGKYLTIVNLYKLDIS